VFQGVFGVQNWGFVYISLTFVIIFFFFCNKSLSFSIVNFGVLDLGTKIEDYLKSKVMEPGTRTSLIWKIKNN